MTTKEYFDAEISKINVDFYEFVERFGIICDNFSENDIKNDEKTDFIKKKCADMLKKEQLSRLGAKKLL
jgi:hypothetical protein